MDLIFFLRNGNYLLPYRLLLRQGDKERKERRKV